MYKRQYDNGLSTDDGPFCDWCLKTIEETVDLFIEKFGRKYDEAVTEPMAKVKGFKEWYFDGILKDTAGYAGTEPVSYTHLDEYKRQMQRLPYAG